MISEDPESCREPGGQDRSSRLAQGWAGSWLVLEPGARGTSEARGSLLPGARRPGEVPALSPRRRAQPPPSAPAVTSPTPLPASLHLPHVALDLHPDRLPCPGLEGLFSSEPISSPIGKGVRGYG